MILIGGGGFVTFWKVIQLRMIRHILKVNVELVCVGEGWGGIIIGKTNYWFFHVSDHFEQFSSFFPHHYIVFKKLIILTDGGYPPPMENSLEIINILFEPFPKPCIYVHYSNKTKSIN